MTDLRNVTILGMMARLNTLIDQGVAAFSIAELKTWIQDGSILTQLCSRYGDFPEFSPIYAAETVLLRQELKAVMDMYDGREESKMGVGNNGLCLLVGYCIEMLMQRRIGEVVG
jgi:hypothetical protein